MEIYYEPQNDWHEEEYYYLHRVLHKILYYYKKNAEEIKKMDASRMSENTKALVKCIVKYYHNDFLFDMIQGGILIKNQKPLKRPLVLDDNPMAEENVYKEMNIVY